MSDRLALFLLLLVCGAFCVWACTPSAVPYLEHSQGAAAWIQAVFSVFAICAAVAIPRMHAADQAAAEHRRHLRLLGKIVSVADAHLASAFEAKDREDLARNFFGREHLARIRETKDALSSYPITVFNSAKEVGDLMALRAGMAMAVYHLERGQAGSITEQRALVLVNHEWYLMRDAIKRLRAD